MKYRYVFLIGITLLINSLSATNRKGQHPQPYQPKFSMSVDPFYQQIVDQVSYDSIYAHLQKLESFGVKEPGTPALENTRDWIHNKLVSYGYTDIVYHDFTYNSYTLQNIITTKPGADQPDVYLILDGHYDTITGPGVNDNGSGTAILLEVARLLSGVECGISIRFINFSAEEEGLIGSNAYVNNVVVPQNMNIRLVLNIDEVGGVAGMVNNTITCERDEGNPPGNNAASAAFTDTLANLTQTYTNLSTQIAHAYGSDYMPFEDAGYVITGFYETNESPYPHTPNDVLANMDPAYATEVAKAAVAAALYFSRAKTSYLNLYHAAAGVVQDTINPYPVELKIRTSGNITGANLNYRVNSSSFFTENMSFAWQNGDTLIYQANIPPQPYYAVIDYYFEVSTDQNLTARLPEDTSAFYQLHVLPDTVGPALQHQPLPDLSYLIQPVIFAVTAEDENGIGQIYLLINKNGGTYQELLLTHSSGHQYSISYPDTLTPGDSIFYRFRATDNSPNQNTTYLPDSGYFAFEVLNSVLFNFETGPNAFSGNGDWQWGTLSDPTIPTPAESKVWATNLSGNYSPNLQSLLESPVIDLTGKQDIRLVIGHFYQIEPANDGGNLKISVNGGTFQLIEPVNGYPFSSLYLFGEPGYSGNSYFWTEDRFDLSPFAGHSVKLQFDFRSDIFTNQRGWYLDYVRLDFRGSAGNHNPQITQYLPVNLDTVWVGSYQTFSISAVDPDGDSLNYRFFHRGEMVPDSVATFTFQTPGADTVTAVVEDPNGGSTAHSWYFTVSDTVTTLSTTDQPISRQFRLLPAFPNPFNSRTLIRYHLPTTTNLELSLFNLLGQKVTVLFSGKQTAGEHSIGLDGRDLSSGIYFVIMETGDFRQSCRILLIK